MKFWRYCPTEWVCFKVLNLESRALNLKFDEKILIIITFFNTIDLYSLETNQLMRKYTGHMAGITAVTYNSNLNLIVSGSADNTIKFWNLKEKKNVLNTINDMIWPVDIRIEFYFDNYYLIISLNSDNFIYITFIEVFDVDNENGSTIKFTNNNFKINLNENLVEIIDINFIFNKKLHLLQLFEVSKSKINNENSNYYYLNSNNYFYNEWLVNLNDGKIDVVKKNEFKKKFSFYFEMKNNNIVSKDDLKIIVFGKR